MKFALLLVTALLGFTVSAHSITVKILEGWKSTPLENSEVTLTSANGRTIETSRTGANGIVVFEKISTGKYAISAIDASGNFTNTSTWSKIKVKSDTEIQLILYPTNKYVRERKAEEDQIYGTIEPRKSTTKIEEEESDENEQEEAEEYSDSLIDAEFPGGTAKMQAFIQENVMYPEMSRELGDQGRIYVQFIVEPDGVITHVSFLRAVTPELEQEAQRLVRAMPNWTPGTLDGEKIRSRCTIPITFILQ